MSCFLVEEKTVAAIADYIEKLCNCGFEYNGMSCPESLRAEIGFGFVNARNIYYQLIELNRRAYFGRYKNENENDYVVEEYKPHDISRRTEYEAGHFKIEYWHYNILKQLSCFIYQCNEDANNENDLLKGLEDLEKSLAWFIVSNSAEFNRAEWGSVDELEPIPQF